MFVSSAFCICLMTRNLNIVEQLCIFHNFESIHIIGSNNQVKSSTTLCEFLQQSNQRKVYENKIYCKNFLLPRQYIIL